MTEFIDKNKLSEDGLEVLAKDLQRLLELTEEICKTKIKEFSYE